MHVALLAEYLKAVNFPQAEYVISGLLSGFPVLGDIPVVPQAPPCSVRSQSISCEELLHRAPSLRSALISKQLTMLSRAQEGSEESRILRELFQQALEDIRLGRMSPLVPATARPDVLGTRRFGVSQRSAKGILKVRSIDDFAESLVNFTTSVRRRISMARVSQLVSSAIALRSQRPDDCLHVLKSDFRAAYRSVPIRSEDIQATDVLVVDPDSRQVFATTQYAMPFGAVGAVYSWDWVSESLVAIIRASFLIPALRYVDDLFFAELACVSSETRELLIEIVTLLGFVLAPDKTPQAASAQDILGVQVVLRGLSAILAVDSGKVNFWLAELDTLASRGLATSSEARRIAGRLSFGCSAVWGRFPRSRLSLLFKLANNISCLLYTSPSPRD